MRAGLRAGGAWQGWSGLVLGRVLAGLRVFATGLCGASLLVCGSLFFGVCVSRARARSVAVCRLSGVAVQTWAKVVEEAEAEEEDAGACPALVR